MSYITEIETTIAGIPCLIGVEEYTAGSYSYHADSDWDYYGTCEWVVLDRKGYKADWLARKLTNKDNDRINDLIEQHMAEEAEYDY